MPPLAPRAFLPPRGFFLAACALLLLCAASYLATPALGSPLLVGGGGFVLERPLLLQGQDVGAALSSMQQALSTVQQALMTTQAALQMAQDDIAELKRRNVQLQGNLTAANMQITELQGSVAELQDTVTTQGGRLSQAEAGIDALEAAQSVMNGTLAEHGTRLVSAESNVAGLDARLATAESNLTGLGTRLAAVESLGLPSTPLTETLIQVRDLTSGTPLYAAVNNLRTLVAGTALTDAVIGMRDLSATSSALYAAINNMSTLTAGTTLTDTIIQVRDLAPGTPLCTAVTGLQTTVSAQDTRLIAAEGGLTNLTTRVSAAENLDGVPTLLTETVKAMRDLIGDSTLVTTVLGLRDKTGNSTLVTTLTNLRDGTDNSSALIRSLPCYGESAYNTWQPYNTSDKGLFIDVSMSACGFSTSPRHVSTSLFGSSRHWVTFGPSSIYFVTATSFRVYILPVTAGIGGNITKQEYTPEEVAGWRWRINWMATR